MVSSGGIENAPKAPDEPLDIDMSREESMALTRQHMRGIAERLLAMAEQDPIPDPGPMLIGAALTQTLADIHDLIGWLEGAQAAGVQTAEELERWSHTDPESN